MASPSAARRSSVLSGGFYLSPCVLSRSGQVSEAMLVLWSLRVAAVPQFPTDSTPPEDPGSGDVGFVVMLLVDFVSIAGLARIFSEPGEEGLDEVFGFLRKQSALIQWIFVRFTLFC